MQLKGGSATYSITNDVIIVAPKSLRLVTPFVLSEQNDWFEDEIKFVIASESDYHWAVSVVNEYSLGGRHVVLFSPVSGALDPAELAGWIIRDNLPVRLQLQLHRILWNGERGR